MDQNNHLNRIKEELERMEDEIIKERKERVTKEGSLFSYRLYEIKVQRCRVVLDSWLTRCHDPSC